MSDIDAAIPRFNWAVFLSQHCDEVGEAGTNLVAICPFCHHDRVSFALSPEKGLWLCYFCGEKGNAVSLLRKVSGLTTSEAIQKLVGEAVDSYDFEIREKPEVEIELPEEFELLTLPESISNRRFWRYAARRGILPALAQSYRIGFARSGRYANTLIIPVTWGGELVSFVARAIRADAEVKILTPFGNKQSQYLFNLDRLLGRNDVLIVEGVFDALAIPDMAVASFGKRLTDAQAGKLVQAGVKCVHICWDADALEEAEAIAERLSLLFDVTVVRLPKGDPSSLGRERVLSAIGGYR